MSLIVMTNAVAKKIGGVVVYTLIFFVAVVLDLLFEMPRYIYRSRKRVVQVAIAVFLLALPIWLYLLLKG